MHSFIEAMRTRLSQERWSLDQAVAEGDAYEQDVHTAELEDLYRIAFQNGIPFWDPAPERPLLDL